MKNYTPVKGLQDSLLFLVSALLIVFVLRTSLLILWEYRHYFPPNLQSDFLVLHSEQFAGDGIWGVYRIAFYAHILSAPVCLLLFCALSHTRFRGSFKQLHRRMGFLNIVLILFCFLPSSIVLACYSYGGWPASASFIVSSIVMAICTWCGWKASKTNKEMHQKWMVRAFAILLSAVLLRALGGATEVLNWPQIPSYQLAAWLSWLIPLAGAEAAIRLSRNKKRTH